MDQYVALDVSLQKTAVCVLNVSSRVFDRSRCVPSEPAALMAFIQTHAPGAAEVGLESGPTSPTMAVAFPTRLPGSRWSAWTPAVPHAAPVRAPLRPITANDAHGLAEMVRMGWYREVQVKRSHGT